MLRNGLKSWRPKKTPHKMKRHGDARLKLVRKKKIRFGREYYGQMKLKLSCLGIIIETMWRKDGEAYSIKNTVPTVKFGDGSIMIWGCFSAKGVGKILVIDGEMNAQLYKHILQENCMSSVKS